MKRAVFLLILVAALFAWRVTALAQSGGSYTLDWFTVNGGGKSGGGSYALVGTIGQSNAGAMSGGSYTLMGGFWGGAASNYNVYLPLVLKNM